MGEEDRYPGGRYPGGRRTRHDADARRTDFAKMGELLSGYLARPGLSGGSGEARSVASAWAGVVGPEGAANTHPLHLRGGKLTVATSSAAWAQAMQDREGEVVGRLERALGPGVVRSVSFRPAGWDPCAGAGGPKPLEAGPASWEGADASSDRGSAVRPGRTLSAEEREAVEMVRRSAADEALGDRIAGAMRASLERARAGEDGEAG